MKEMVLLVGTISHVIIFFSKSLRFTDVELVMMIPVVGQKINIDNKTNNDIDEG